VKWSYTKTKEWSSVSGGRVVKAVKCNEVGAVQWLSPSEDKW